MGFDEVYLHLDILHSKILLWSSLNNEYSQQNLVNVFELLSMLLTDREQEFSRLSHFWSQNSRPPNSLDLNAYPLSSKMRHVVLNSVSFLTTDRQVQKSLNLRQSCNSESFLFRHRSVTERAPNGFKYLQISTWKFKVGTFVTSCCFEGFQARRRAASRKQKVS